MKHLLTRRYAARRAVTWRRFVLRTLRGNNRELWLAVLYFALLAAVPLAAWARG